MSHRKTIAAFFAGVLAFLLLAPMPVAGQGPRATAKVARMQPPRSKQRQTSTSPASTCRRAPIRFTSCESKSSAPATEYLSTIAMCPSGLPCTSSVRNGRHTVTRGDWFAEFHPLRFPFWLQTGDGIGRRDALGSAHVAKKKLIDR